jgi:hypothetical protein
MCIPNWAEPAQERNQALNTLGLDENATAEKPRPSIKPVKRLHPMPTAARENEDTLKAVIHAYDIAGQRFLLVFAALNLPARYNRLEPRAFHNTPGRRMNR